MFFNIRRYGKVVIASIICLGLASFSTNVTLDRNNEIETLINKIEAQEFLFKNYNLNRKSKSTASKLLKIASEDDLMKLSNHDCKLCFSYSFWVLAKRGSSRLDNVYTDYINRRGLDLTQLNDFGKNKSCVKIIYTESNFINEIYLEKKYLDQFK